MGHQAGKVIFSFTGNRHGGNVAIIVGQNVGDKGDTSLDIASKNDQGMQVGAKISFKAIDLCNVNQAPSAALPQYLNFFFGRPLI